MSATSIRTADMDGLVERLCRDGVTLVIGGDTARAESWADRGAKYVYAVPAATQVAIADRGGRPNLRVLTSEEFARFAFPARHFDLISFTPAADDAPDPAAFPAYARRLLRTDGALILHANDQYRGAWSTALGEHFADVTPARSYSGRALLLARRPRPVAAADRVAA